MHIAWFTGSVHPDLLTPLPISDGSGSAPIDYLCERYCLVPSEGKEHLGVISNNQCAIPEVDGIVYPMVSFKRLVAFTEPEILPEILPELLTSTPEAPSPTPTASLTKKTQASTDSSGTVTRTIHALVSATASPSPIFSGKSGALKQASSVVIPVGFAMVALATILLFL